MYNISIFSLSKHIGGGKTFFFWYLNFERNAETERNVARENEKKKQLEKNEIDRNNWLEKRVFVYLKKKRMKMLKKRKKESRFVEIAYGKTIEDLDSFASSERTPLVKCKPAIGSNCDEQTRYISMGIC